MNLKLNEELLSNLFLKHYIHYQFFVDLLSARYCDCFTFSLQQIWEVDIITSVWKIRKLMHRFEFVQDHKVGGIGLFGSRSVWLFQPMQFNKQIFWSSARNTVLLGGDQVKRCFEISLDWGSWTEGVELRIVFFWIFHGLPRDKEFKNNSSQGFSSSRVRQEETLSMCAL